MWSYQVKLYEERELAVLDVMREEDRTENRTEIFLLAGHYVFTAVILSCCQPPLIPAGGLRRVRPVSPCTVRRAGQGGEDRPGPDAQCLRATVRRQEAETWSVSGQIQEWSGSSC